MAQAIGVVSQTAGTVTAVNSDGYERTLGAGDQIYEGEVVSAQGGSGVNITFNNGCTMALGEGETALIDETVYKLEFFEDADVVVDLENAQGIATEVAAEEEEVVDEVYLAEDDADEMENINLNEIEETAAGGTAEVTQVDVGEIEERVDFDTQEEQSGGQTQSSSSESSSGGGISATEVDRGGELQTSEIPTAPTFTILNLDSSGFVNGVPVLSGSAPEGSVIEVFDYNNTIVTTTVDSSETFTIEPELEDGEHSLTARLTIDGVTSEMSDPIVFTLDTTAPEVAIIESAEVTNSTIPTISGQTEAQSSVEVTVADETYEVTADESGHWSVTLNETAEGTYDVTVVVTDQAGNVSEPVTSSMTIDTTLPDNPIVNTLAATNDATPTITGSAEAGGTVTLYKDGVEVGETGVDENGSWSYTFETLSDGTYSISAVVSDSAGNVSGPSVSQSLVVDTVQPELLAIEIPDVTNSSTPVISGTGTPGDTVNALIAGTTVSTEIADDGTWSLSLGELEDGSYSVSVTVTDSAGNVSPSVTGTIVVDQTAPQLPVIDQIDMNSEGVIVISGTAEAGSTMNVEIAGQNYTTNAENGSWSITTNSVGEGTYVFEVTSTDLAGNSSGTATASVMLNHSVVSATIDYSGSGTEGTQHTIEDATLYGIQKDADFDPDATSLNLGVADSGFVSSHEKGYGVSGGYKGEGDKKAIGSDEALVIQLDSAVNQLDVSINKLNFYQAGHWIAYDTNLEKVGEGDFSFFGSLFGRDDSYESGLFSSSGSLSIGADDVDAAFEYVVFTTAETFQGSISSYFVEDIAYETADSYIYDMTIENVPVGDAMTTLYIDGLDDGVRLQDSEGNSVGNSEDGVWMLDEGEITDLVTINGTIDLQIVSESELSDGSVTPTFTLVESSLESLETEVADAFSPLSATSQILDFENLEDVQRIDLSEDEINMNGLNLKDVIDLSAGQNRLEIVSGEHDEHVLRLDSADWTLKTDADGNAISFESDGNAYTVYTSTDADNEYDLIIDQLITIELEN